MKYQITDFGSDRLCAYGGVPALRPHLYWKKEGRYGLYYLWHSLVVCLYPWQTACWQQTDIWNYLAIACSTMPTDTLPSGGISFATFETNLCRSYTIQQKLVIFTHTGHVLFAHLKTHWMLNGNIPINRPSNFQRLCLCILFKTWTSLHCFKGLLHFGATYIDKLRTNRTKRTLRLYELSQGFVMLLKNKELNLEA